MNADAYRADRAWGRRRYIRRSIARYGLPLGAAVTAWTVAAAAPSLEHLHTFAGWARLAGLVVLGVGEWVIGAGWVIGQALWYLHQHPIISRPHR